MFCVVLSINFNTISIYYVYFLSKNGLMIYFIFAGYRQLMADIFYSIYTIYTRSQVKWVDMTVFSWC